MLHQTSQIHPWKVVLFCKKFMGLNLCQADSWVQHHNPNSKNHLSIAIAKSTTPETPDRVYAKLGMPF